MRRLMIPIIALSITVPATLTAQRPGQRPAAAQRTEARAADRPQAKGQGVDPIQRILERRQALGLTASQVTQIERVQTRLNEKNKPLLEQLNAARPAGGVDGMMPPQAREKLRERMAVRRDSVQDLTEEQRKELRARAEARRDSMQAGGDVLRQKVRARADSMTPEQRAKLREEMQGRSGDIRCIRDCAMGEKAEELRPVLEEVRANTEKALKQVESILTAEQRAKVGAMRPAAVKRGGQRQAP